MVESLAGVLKSDLTRISQLLTALLLLRCLPIRHTTAYIAYKVAGVREITVSPVENCLVLF